MTKYDIRNDPKFANRVKKLEGNKYSKILKEPLRVSIGTKHDSAEHEAFVACIGLNDAYLVVSPIFNSDKFLGFDAFWTKSDAFNKATALHEVVSNAVTNWLMMHADETSFVKKKHVDIKISEVAVECCSKVIGHELIEKAGPVFEFCIIQSSNRYDINNPYHKG